MDIRRLFQRLGRNGRPKPTPRSAATLVAVPNDDETVLRAAWEAVQAFPQFLRALRAPSPGTRDFCVKVRLRENNVSEFVWVEHLVVAPGQLVGRLQSQPRHVSGYARGEPMVVPFADVFDWTFMEGAERRGNYTGLAVEALQRASPPPP